MSEILWKNKLHLYMRNKYYNSKDLVTQQQPTAKICKNVGLSYFNKKAK